MSRVLLTLSMTVLLAVIVLLFWYQLRENQKVEAAVDGNSVGEMLGPFRKIDNPQPLPEFHFVDGNGVTHTLEDFRGRTVLVNIWATWCPPCRKEMPSLDRLHSRMGGDDFQVLAISTDLHGISPVQEFYRTAGIASLEAYIDQNGETENALKLPGLPTTLLVDKAGRAIGVKVGPAEWDSDEVAALISKQISSSTNQVDN